MKYVYINTKEVFDYIDFLPEDAIIITDEQCEGLLNNSLIWKNKELVPSHGRRAGDWHTDMIKIGITGSYGKTSTCEMLYQYLLASGKSVLMISTNGIFRNNETIIKNLFNTSMPKRNLEQFLDENYAYYDVDYAIVEVIAELFISNNKYIDFDIVGLTNFREQLTNHFNNDTELYRQCKNRALSLGTISLVPINISNSFIHTDTYQYKDSFQEYNLHHSHNISLAIAILEKLNLYNLPVFPYVVLRGRYERFDNIIIDTGWCGFEQILPLYPMQKIKLIYVPIWCTETVAVKRYRDQARDALCSCEKIYIPISITEDMSTIQDVFLKSSYNNFEILENNKVCFDKAISELQEDEILFIMAREDFREFREYVKEIKGIE